MKSLACVRSVRIVCLVRIDSMNLLAVTTVLHGGAIPYPVRIVLIVFGAIVFVVAIATGVSSRND